MLWKCFKKLMFLYLKADSGKHSSKGFDRGYDFQQLSYRLCYRQYLGIAETVIDGICFLPLLL